MIESQRISPSLRENPCLQQAPNVAQRGFTLLELMIVITILGALMAIALPSFQDWREQSAVNNATNISFVRLKQARTLAVAESRNVKVSFSSTAPYTITYDAYTAGCGPNVCKNLVTGFSQFSPDLKVSGVTNFTFSREGTVGGNTAKLEVGSYAKCITVNNIGRAYIKTCP